MDATVAEILKVLYGAPRRPPAALAPPSSFKGRLPQVPGGWRVDWYDRLQRTLTGGTAVTAHLSAPGGERQKLAVPLGAFIKTPIGSVVEASGPTETRSAPSRYSPRRVVISRERLRAVHVDDIAGGRKILGREHYPGLPAETDAIFLAVQHRRDRFHLLVPMLEVLRFYYGTSLHVLELLLGEAFKDARDQLFAPRSQKDGVGSGNSDPLVPEILSCSSL